MVTRKVGIGYTACGHGRRSIGAGWIVAALRKQPAQNAPVAGAHNQYRGAPLALRDGLTRKALGRLDDVVNAGKLASLWTACLDAPPHQGPDRWLHGDLHGGNLIVRDGVLVGVIDFGLLGIGDPAVDLIPAWSFLEEANRDAFRHAAGAGPGRMAPRSGLGPVDRGDRTRFLPGNEPGPVRPVAPRAPGT